MAKVYHAPETTVEWTDNDNTPDELLDLGGLAAGAVACGAYLDLGAGPRADLFEVEFFIDGLGAGTGVVGSTVDLLFIQSNDATNFDGKPTTAPGDTTQGTITTDQLRNAQAVGSVAVYSTTEADNLMQGRFITKLTGRYVAPVVVNRTAVALNASTEHHYVRLTPIPADIQVS